MENNKAYLQKLHWVFLLAIGYGLLYMFRLFDRDVNLWTQILVTGGLSITIQFVALGIITKKTKETIIAWGTGFIPLITEACIATDAMPPAMRIALFFLYHLPLLVYMGLLYGWNRKLVPAYFFIMIALSFETMGFVADKNISDLIAEMTSDRIYDMKYIGLACRILTFVCLIICVCEIMNYLQGKKYGGKTTLLNLGNEYKKGISILLFIILHLAFFVVVTGIGQSIMDFVRMIIRSDRGSVEPTAYHVFTKIMGIPFVLMQIGAAVFLAWYQRKFLLESFISFGVSSRLVYWIMQVPLLGIFGYIVAVSSGIEKNTVAEKVGTLEKLAASSPTAVSVIFFLLMGIRLIMHISSFGEGEGIVIVSDIINMLLFIWLMAAKSGYYAALALNFLSLVFLLLSPFLIGDGEGISLAWILPFATINVVQLILFLPVYHLEEFEYMPAGDPVSEKPENVHLL